MTEARQRLGKKGEDAACAYLERKGYTLSAVVITAAVMERSILLPLKAASLVL